MNLSELRCCHPECERIPDWVITEQDAGPDVSTQACTDHVGYMLTGTDTTSGDFFDVATIGSILTPEEMAA